MKERFNQFTYKYFGSKDSASALCGAGWLNVIVKNISEFLI